MYDVGGKAYPYVVKSYQEGAHIVAEVYDVPTEMLNRTIRMEQQAGYEIAVVDTPYGAALLCVYAYHQVRKEDKQVLSGDWLQYAAERVA